MINKEAAKKAAEQGLIPSIKCSIEHHEDGLRFSNWRLLEAFQEGTFHFGPALCALCQFYESVPKLLWNCGSCCLGPKACCKELCKAGNRFVDNPSNDNFDAFKIAEAFMIARLEKELLKAEKEAAAKKEPEPAKPNNIGIGPNAGLNITGADNVIIANLRNWDYGRKHGDGFIHLNGKTHWIVCKRRFMEESTSPPESFVKDVTGNLLDDLK